MLIGEIRKINNDIDIFQYAFYCNDHLLTCCKIKEWCRNRDITYRLYNSHDIGRSTSKTMYVNHCSIVFDNENAAKQFAPVISQLIWLGIVGLYETYDIILP